MSDDQNDASKDDQSQDQADSLEAARQDSAATTDADPVSGCPDSELTWIEIALQSETGEPVPDEEYFVTASDGSEHSGNLDQNGFARLDQIPAGTCQVSFPLLEDDEWDSQAGASQPASENDASQDSSAADDSDGQKAA